MAVKVGINGFGRIGRLLARILGEGYPGLELVGVNSRSDSFTKAHLMKYDSVHRTYPLPVEHDDDHLIINGKKIATFRQDQPCDCPWGELGARIVLDSTGKFKTSGTCSGHIDAGAEKVLIGAPGKGKVDATFVMGVNHEQYDPARHTFVSNASCTTNCLAPIAKVLNDSFGIEYGMMTTTHSYTMSQRILDGSSKDIRRARAAALSIIPTSTGAARAIGEVLPELDGKLDGMAIRVPVADVSMVDLICKVDTPTTVEEVNQKLRQAADGPMKGYLAVTKTPLVSVDYTGCPYSSVVDAPLTQVRGGTMVKVMSWYDNEMGYSHRMVDLAAHMAGYMK